MPDFDAETAVQSLHPLQSDPGAGFDADGPPDDPVAAPEEPNAVEPEVTIVSPTNGELGLTDAIVFDVTDDEGEFHAVFVWVNLLDIGSSEVVHDGDSFAARYVALSSRAAIADGYRYTVRRSGGWPQPVLATATPQLEIRIKAIDSAGNQST